MRAKSNISLTSLAIIILILFCWCSYVERWAFERIGGIALWALMIVAGILVITTREKQLIKESQFAKWRFIFYIAYGFFFSLGWGNLVQVHVGPVTLPKQIHDLLFNILIIESLIAVTHTSLNNQRISQKFLYYVLLTVSIGNIIVVMMDPSLSKTEAAEGGLFVLGYAMSYVLALNVPICVYHIENHENKAIRSRYLILLVVMIISMYFAGYLIALVTGIGSIVLYFIFNSKNRKAIIVRSILFVVLILGVIYMLDISSLLGSIADMTEEANIQKRLYEIGDFMQEGGDLEGLEGKSTFRFYIYQFTLKQFFSHPILGNFIFGNFRCFYDHCTFLDLLAVGGILLAIPFCKMLTSGYKAYSDMFYDVKAKRALQVIYISYFFLSLCNSVFSSRFLGVLFFSAVILLSNSKVNKSSE